jgi:recombination protein RecA
MARRKIVQTEEIDLDDVAESAPHRDPKRVALAKVAATFGAWKPAREVLTSVKAVPTIFPQYDRATRVGGHPIQRVTVVHGPSGMGKTSLTHGLGLSFLQRDHVYANVDAEYTTPSEWLASLMHEHADNPGFVAIRPNTYEETVDAVRDLVTKLHKAVTDGILSPLTSGLVVVDSIRKLVPEDFWAKVHKHGAQGKQGSVDGMSGRGAQIKAKMNADWLDELTPLLYRTNTAMVLIARESEDTNADHYAKMYGNDWKMTGGKAIEFDASLIIRVQRAGWVMDPPTGGADAKVYGERHKLTIRKTKVAGKDDKNIVCFFHTSNGVLIPEGFDRARDVIELAREYGIIDGAGQWLKWRNMKWQGVHKAVKSLTEKPEALASLEADVRARFPFTDALPTEAD